jgi:hypothetical protein
METRRTPFRTSRGVQSEKLGYSLSPERGFINTMSLFSIYSRLPKLNVGRRKGDWSTGHEPLLLANVSRGIPACVVGQYALVPTTRADITPQKRLAPRTRSMPARRDYFGVVPSTSFWRFAKRQSLPTRQRYGGGKRGKTESRMARARRRLLQFSQCLVREFGERRYGKQAEVREIR